MHTNITLNFAANRNVLLTVLARFCLVFWSNFIYLCPEFLCLSKLSLVLLKLLYFPTISKAKWVCWLVLFHFINGLQSGLRFGGGVIPMSLFRWMFLASWGGGGILCWGSFDGNFATRCWETAK